MKVFRILPYCVFLLALLFSGSIEAQTTVTIGTGSSSSSTRGPFQRADTNSSTVFSRWHMVYTQAELATAGILTGNSISQLNWEIASSNVIIGSGNANVKIYIKNSTATTATTGTWTALTTGSTLALDTDYNTTNNFPGANGWMPFALTTPVTYTGGALEISVDWDCSQVSTPAFSGNGAIKFRWESTSPTDLVVKKTASSSAPSTISDLKDERANIQIVYNTASCDPPATLNAFAYETTADVNWTSSSLANSYNWKVVAAGSGAGAMAVDSGNTMTNMAMASGLMAMTGYDLYVQSDCGSGTSSYGGPYTFLTRSAMQDTTTIGLGTSSSSTRGPFQRSDTNSTTVFTRFNHVYTASELATAGITNGDVITSLNWELASSNLVSGNGNAAFKVYVKNSSATAATSDTWVNLISGSTMVIDNNYNTVNNFPGANGWMAFNFNAPFTYTGGALEIAVDWDCSQVSTPAFSGDGALKWRWESTSPADLVAKKTASSSAPSTLSDLKSDRANIQIVTVGSGPAPCAPATALNVDSVQMTSAFLSWTASPTAMSYNWKVVAAGTGSGAMALDSGSTSGVSIVATGLTKGTSYDLYTASDCGAGGMSAYAGPLNFMTSDNIGLNDLDLVKQMSVSPNPTNGIARLDLDLTVNSEVAVSIYSIKGEFIGEVFNGNVNQLSQEIDLSIYDGGLYLIRVSINGQTTSKKVMVIK
jgi:hypothetical protein